MTDMLEIIFLVSVVGTGFGLDFTPYVQVEDRTVDGAVMSFTTRLFAECIARCRTEPDCGSVTYTETTATCQLHNQHPVQEGVVTLLSQGSRLYYTPMNYCASIGGNIVKIENNEEQTFIGNTAVVMSGTNLHYWIGAYWSSSPNAFVWYDGSSVGYEAWGDSNPNAFTGCVDITAGIAWGWNDHIYCESLLQYICEIDLVIV